MIQKIWLQFLKEMVAENMFYVEGDKIVHDP